MKSLFTSWPFWALLSAGFAALTAIFAKIGIGIVDSDSALQTCPNGLGVQKRRNPYPLARRATCMRPSLVMLMQASFGKGCP